MTTQTTAVFEDDGTTSIAVVKSSSGETVTIDRANGIGISARELLLMSLAYCTLGAVREDLMSNDPEKVPLRVEVDCGFDAIEQNTSISASY